MRRLVIPGESSLLMEAAGVSLRACGLTVAARFRELAKTSHDVDSPLPHRITGPFADPRGAAGCFDCGSGFGHGMPCPYGSNGRCFFVALLQGRETHFEA